MTENIVFKKKKKKTVRQDQRRHALRFEQRRTKGKKNALVYAPQ